MSLPNRAFSCLPRTPTRGHRVEAAHAAAVAIGFVVAAALAAVAFMATPALAQWVAEPQVAAQPSTEDRYPKHGVPFADGVTGYPDLTYATLSGYRPLTLDLYLPPASMPAPAAGFPLVAYVHGGDYTSGHARQSGAFVDFPGVLASLAARGYVVASVNYRLSGEAPSPAAAMDVKTAIRWLRTKAGEYRVDPVRAAVWGASAGGQLATLVAATCGVRAFDPDALPPELANQSDCVQAAVAWYGVFDFSALREHAGVGENDPTPGVRAATAHLGCDPAHCPPGLVRGASSTTYVDRNDPPMLLVHGTADAIVPYRQSEQMAVTLGSAGVPYRLLLLPDVGHGFVGTSPEATRGASLQALQATFDFLDRTIGAIR